MLDAGSGLVLGRLDDNRRHFVSAISSLFNLRVTSLTACRQFLCGASRKDGKPTREAEGGSYCHLLSHGGGKGVSVAIPFLQTCPDSCVVLDFKGELARIFADSAARWDMTCDFLISSSS